MEDALKRALGAAVLRPTGHSGGGCISQGQSYYTDRGRVLMKSSCEGESRRIFLGETIQKTQRVRVSKSIKVVELPGDNIGLVMEHLEMKSLNRHSVLLGIQLADLHLHNQQLREKVNNWRSDWVSFFAIQRIQAQMNLIEKSSGDREARELWAQFQLKIPNFFCGVKIVPSLLHGDLWGGNVAEDDSGSIIFDPASFYSHSEYDLAIAGMFGGFSSSFYSAYHSKIPRAAGFEKHLKLYQLFHYMNHWNHFGSGYRGSSINIMINLVK